MYPTSQMSPAPSEPAAGSPCWLELASDQPDQAMAFYQTIMGWEYQQRTDGGGHEYFVATLLGEPVAGIRPVRRGLADWTVYLATADLTGLLRHSDLLGGNTIEAAHTVPAVGTKALVAAPAGAVFGACQLAADWAFLAGVPNSLVWAEFITHRAPQADQFFGELFGYTGQQIGNGIDDDYMVWFAGEDSVIGRVQMMPGTPLDTPARWVAHFRTPLDRDFDDAVIEAHEAGARLRFRPYSSQFGRVAMMSDPTGVRFALIDPALAVESAGGSGADDPFDD
jgi:predicted enzyme related to lactoylglutathione lyase